MFKIPQRPSHLRVCSLLSLGQPKRGENGVLIFEDYPNFTPNLTPKEVCMCTCVPS